MHPTTWNSPHGASHADCSSTTQCRRHLRGSSHHSYGGHYTFTESDFPGFKVGEPCCFSLRIRAPHDDKYVWQGRSSANPCARIPLRLTM
eukprot:6487285-Amphidinium_carterae.1